MNFPGMQTLKSMNHSGVSRPREILYIIKYHRQLWWAFVNCTASRIVSSITANWPAPYSYKGKQSSGCCQICPFEIQQWKFKMTMMENLCLIVSFVYNELKSCRVPHQSRKLYQQEKMMFWGPAAVALLPRPSSPMLLMFTQTQKWARRSIDYGITKVLTNTTIVAFLMLL